MIRDAETTTRHADLFNCIGCPADANPVTDIEGVFDEEEYDRREDLRESTTNQPGESEHQRPGARDESRYLSFECHRDDENSNDHLGLGFSKQLKAL